VLQNFQAAAAKERSELNSYFGDTKNPVKIDIGYGTGQPDADFQELYNFLVDADTEAKTGRPVADWVPTLKAGLEQDGQLAAFMAYADRRSGLAKEYELPLGETMRVKYRTPQEFREILGLEAPTEATMKMNATRTDAGGEG
jgi:hypothetical protein